MPIDPVVVLAEELRSAEYTVRAACEQRKEDALTCLMARAAALYKELIETVPTSALGAGELICLAATNLTSVDKSCALQMRKIANRLMSGLRLQEDLIWLRRTAAGLTQGRRGEIGRSSAALLHLAIRGAARPVIVYRAVELTPVENEREAGTG
jgi:hypothetical protein